MHVTNIQAVADSKQQNKFSFVNGESKKEYIWKCDSPEIRDQWVKGIKDQQTYSKELVAYLETNSIAVWLDDDFDIETDI